MSDLVTLAQAQDYLGITADGASSVIQTLIDNAEAWVARRLSVAFSEATATEIIDGGQGRVRLRWQPVRAISGVTDLTGSESIDKDDFTIVGGVAYYKPSGTKTDLPAGYQRFAVAYSYGYNDGDTSPDEGTSAAPTGLALAILSLCYRVYTVPGGLTNQSAAGAAQTLDQLPSGEVEALLKPFDINRREW